MSTHHGHPAPPHQCNANSRPALSTVKHVPATRPEQFGSLDGSSDTVVVFAGPAAVQLIRVASHVTLETLPWDDSVGSRAIWMH